ncbi:putative magnesium or manganese-dependent protein phosphatase [Actinacidiphila reveromycinica]|uniref:Putative magnesium or manganese-dependent protein phosphatase n=1 Tax=Actinacidiphila reveromycinica TaxID=659352 RepID=A0A7U3VSF8_9ACTN|nr:SpoIIE family protein phosphatase [Streptomyces sp. SN-593]BBB01878.1 putative magnesium or manganese-dependent protein phosphatase [Streptomyces sp. SN-593]
MARRQEPLFTVDGIGRVTSWSAAAARRFAHGEEAALGRPADALIRSAALGPDPAGGDPGLLAVPLEEDGAWALYAQPRGPQGLDAAIEDALLRALLSESQLSIVVLDTDLRLVRVSMATQALRRPGADIMGKRVDEAYPLDRPQEELAVLERVLSTGEPVYSRLVGTAVAGRTGRRFFSASAFRLSRPAGEVIGVAVTLLDVTRRERDHVRRQAVSRVRQEVGRSLGLARTCEDLAGALVPEFADIVLVALAEQVTAGDNPPSMPADPAALLLRTVAVQGRADGADGRKTGGADHAEDGGRGGDGADGADAGDAPGIEWIEAVGDIGDIGDVEAVERESSFAQAVTEGRPVLRTTRRAAHLLDLPAHDEILRAAGAHSMVVIPLAVRGRLLGLAVAVRTGDSARYLRADLAAAEEIGLHTALCLENARRSAVARVIASTVQRRFLPERPRSALGVETAFVALSPPSRKGAWFDVIPLSGARCALATGEIGRGGTASLTAMGRLRTTLRALADLELQPDEVLARLSDTVAGIPSDAALPEETGALSVACTYGVYDPATSVFTVSCAGQPAPRVIAPDGGVVRLGEAVGPRLGGEGMEPFGMVTHSVPHGATLLLASADFDEVLDSGGELRQALRTSGSVQDLANALFVKLAPQPGRSGTAMLARTNRLGTDRTIAWELPAADEAASKARRLTRQWLRDRSATVTAETVESAELLVSELVTNAVRYGAPPITLRLTLNDALTVEVRDHRTATPSIRHARVTDEGGRGLLIVSHLSGKWGTRRVEEGKAVWAEQSMT